ncbi:leucine-rich repeat domain-containing protein [Pararobbsia alpina]|uniref:NEL domain-containing protein n=1 Tax=Pararobbsia alpina TaxID=621374 RepID=A0A6S7B0Y4_9BURK|nr:leucine-rich repeat domain-containing protein [Pararobbsia alpina]CAB3783509.1 hypothetical protein LMG28138_01654 [Pararobbsia alpina]
MKVDASRAARLATWGSKYQVTATALERIRNTLDSRPRDLDLSLVAVREVPPFLRNERMLDSLTLRFVADEQIRLDMGSLPRMRTLRIVGSEIQSLLVTGEGPLRLRRRESGALEVSGSETLEEIKLSECGFDTVLVSDVPRLYWLDVADSRLQRLTVSHAPQLERLNASVNALPEGGIELSSTSRLTSVSLAMAQFSRVPPALREAPALRELDLHVNQISTVEPADLPGPLVSLDLSGNRLTAAPLDFAFRATLRDLSLGTNCIGHIPDTIDSFVHLETLDLSHNRIMVLPFAIGRCTLLRTLKLSSNRLSWLPPEVGKLASLETLHLDCNMLMALPEEIACLTRLSALQVRQNLLYDLPARLDEMRLRRLDLNGNPLFSVPEPLLRERTRAGQPSLESLVALDLGNTRLADLPTGLGQRSALVQLRLHENPHLCELPFDLVKLRSLRWLDLVGCGFRQLPPVLEGMAAHTDVFLDRNPLDHGVHLETWVLPSAVARGASARVTSRPTAGTVIEEVGIWRAFIGKSLTPKQKACWNVLFPFKNSHVFAFLLAGLRASREFLQGSDAGRTRFAFGVNRMLVDIEENPELRAYILDEAAMAAAALADRHRQVFDRLALAARLHVLAKGVAADGLLAALSMRESFRRESVATLAAAQEGGNKIDFEVALDLAYRIQLARAPGGFSFGYDERLDRMCVRLSDSHIADTLADIRAAEERELVEYMVASPVWRRYLTRSRADAYLATIARFDYLLGLSDDAMVAAGLARSAVLEQRECAVLAWLRGETIGLLTDNPLMSDPT